MALTTQHLHLPRNTNLCGPIIWRNLCENFENNRSSTCKFWDQLSDWTSLSHRFLICKRREFRYVLQMILWELLFFIVTKMHFCLFNSFLLFFSFHLFRRTWIFGNFSVFRHELVHNRQSFLMQACNNTQHTFIYLWEHKECETHYCWFAKMYEIEVTLPISLMCLTNGSLVL